MFTYPLVMNYRTMYMQAIKGDGKFGKWLHLGLSSPADTDIVTPNNDTPYSYAWVDLRPSRGCSRCRRSRKRFYTSQWDDLWGYVLDNPGSVIDGNDGHSFLLASPTWKGEMPQGIKRVVRGESDFLGTLDRTQVIGGAEGLAAREGDPAELQAPAAQPVPRDPGPGSRTRDPVARVDGGRRDPRSLLELRSFLLPLTTPASRRLGDVRRSWHRSA